MIKVGINENVYIKDASIVADDNGGKKRLEIKFAEETGVKKSENILDQFNGSEEASDLTERSISLWPFDNKVMEGEFDPSIAKNRIDEVKDPLNHILLGYMTSAEIKWNIFAGIPVTADNVNTLILQQETLSKIFDNIANQFITMIKPHLGSKKLFRFLAVRQSAKKHYPALRKKFLADQPFWESMEIPAEASKLKFSSYEIKKGLDNDVAIEADEAEDTTASEGAKKVFGQR